MSSTAQYLNIGNLGKTVYSNKLFVVADNIPFRLESDRKQFAVRHEWQHLEKAKSEPIAHDVTQQAYY